MTSTVFKEQAKEMRKELSEKERLKQPSIYPLKRIGNKLLDIVKDLKKENSELETSLYSMKMGLNIYLADLTGELQHDYDKNNKRYRGKWLNESR